MAESPSKARLDQIETRWSLVRRAHGEGDRSAREARQALVLRYSSAIRAYMAGITRDVDQADELAQEAVVRMMQGDFAGADPDRGRFRDLLKVALRNMARNLWSRQKRRRSVDVDVELCSKPESDHDSSWMDAWSSNVLLLAWDRLEAYERRGSATRPFSILKLRSSLPDATSEELARIVGEHWGWDITPATFRQHLRRARVCFGGFLIEEIADGLERPSGDDVEEELVALGLSEYVRGIIAPDWKDAFDRRRAP